MKIGLIVKRWFPHGTNKVFEPLSLVLDKAFRGEIVGCKKCYQGGI